MTRDFSRACIDFFECIKQEMGVVLSGASSLEKTKFAVNIFSASLRFMLVFPTLDPDYFSNYAGSLPKDVKGAFESSNVISHMLSTIYAFCVTFIHEVEENVKRKGQCADVSEAMAQQFRALVQLINQAITVNVKTKSNWPYGFQLMALAFVALTFKNADMKQFDELAKSLGISISSLDLFKDVLQQWHKGMRDCTINIVVNPLLEGVPQGRELALYYDQVAIPKELQLRKYGEVESWWCATKYVAIMFGRYCVDLNHQYPREAEQFYLVVAMARAIFDELPVRAGWKTQAWLSQFSGASFERKDEMLCELGFTDVNFSSGCEEQMRHRIAALGKKMGWTPFDDTQLEWLLREAEPGSTMAVQIQNELYERACKVAEKQAQIEARAKLAAENEARAKLAAENEARAKLAAENEARAKLAAENEARAKAAQQVKRKEASATPAAKPENKKRKIAGQAASQGQRKKESLFHRIFKSKPKNKTNFKSDRGKKRRGSELGSPRPSTSPRHRR